jgi:hypothetical protein
MESIFFRRSGNDRGCHLLNEETDATGLLAGVQTKIERETSREKIRRYLVLLGESDGWKANRSAPVWVSTTVEKI